MPRLEFSQGSKICIYQLICYTNIDNFGATTQVRDHLPMSQWNTDYITPDSAKNLHNLFRIRVEHSSDSIAYRYFDHREGEWRQYTWQQSLETINQCRAGLMHLGLKKGDAVGIMLRNCPEWVFLEQACMAEGIISVPLYPNDRADNVSYIVNESEIKLILIEDNIQWTTLLEASDEIINTIDVISLSEIKNSANDKLQHFIFTQWLTAAESASLTDTYSDIDPHSLATIVYTSGTTGRPKGVMLSHWNILTNAYAGINSVTVFNEDLFLSFLPLSHTLERTVGYYIPVMTGATVAYSRSIPQLAEDLLAIKPTVLIAVPRIYERVYGKIINQVAEKSPIAKKLFQWTESVGWENYEHTQGKCGFSWRLIFWPLLNALVAKKIMAKLGGRLRFSISGGAPLPEAVSHLFIAFGLRILQGYGLTESSPVISVNKVDKDVPSSIGIALEGIKVRIADNHELQTKSDSVMLGYWKKEDATKEVMTEDGWLKTGDLARMEGEHIFITGRIKEILVLSNGEKVPPVDMEIAISLDPLFEQAMVIGEGKPFLTAVVVLDKEQWTPVAKSLGLDPEDPRSLTNNQVRQLMLKKIGNCLSDFPGYAQIRQVKLSLETWTDINFFLTAAMKMRRQTLLEHFKEDIDKMYQGH